jgi:hypothetical protein
MTVKIKIRPPAKPSLAVKVDKDAQLRQEAETAVLKFEQERESLLQMREEFQQTFPDAVDALEAIKQQEDVVNDAIAQAKIRIAQAKISVGDFLCKRAFSAPGYDDDALTEILRTNSDRTELFVALVDAGVIKKVVTDRQAAAIFAAQNPKDSKPLQPAWEDKKELTPKVTVPKGV